jgi:hypothetical protein
MSPIRPVIETRKHRTRLSRSGPLNDLSKGGALGRHSGGGIRTRDPRVMSCVDRGLLKYICLSRAKSGRLDSLRSCEIGTKIGTGPTIRAQTADRPGAECRSSSLDQNPLASGHARSENHQPRRDVDQPRRDVGPSARVLRRGRRRGRGPNRAFRCGILLDFPSIGLWTGLFTSRFDPVRGCQGAQSLRRRLRSASKKRPQTYRGMRTTPRPAFAQAPRRATRVQVRSLANLAERYNLRPPDELVGPKSSQFFLDYGPPVILADSTRPSRRAQSERALWKNMLSSGAEPGLNDGC